MAKRKLSPEQRDAIRKEIRQYLAKKIRPAEIQRIVAKKYGITTITARWYLKSVRDPQFSSAGRPTPTKGSKPSPARKIVKKPAKRNGHPQAGNAVHRLVASIQAIAEATFSRGRQAKKLIPRWRAYVTRVLSLKKMETRVRRELRAASIKAQALQRKIRELTNR